MKNIKVSVIVPIYNVERYLNECLDSIINQTYKNLEIILVNDGSTDKSGEIAKEYAKKDNRIKLVTKKNAGLGYARNTGLEHVTGKYVYFIDSDDYVAEDALETAVKELENSNADLSIFGYKTVSETNKEIESHVAKIEQTEFVGKDICEKLLPELIYSDRDTTDINLSVCCMVLKTEMIEKANWKFTSERDIISEDVCSFLELVKYLNKVIIIKQDFYRYRVSLNSLTHKYDEERIDKIEKFYDYCVKRSKELKFNEQVILNFKKRYMAYIIAYFKQIERLQITSKEKVKIFNKMLRKYNIKNKIIYDDTNLSKKVLYFFIKLKCGLMIYTLVKIKNRQANI